MKPSIIATILWFYTALCTLVSVVTETFAVAIGKYQVAFFLPGTCLALVVIIAKEDWLETAIDELLYKIFLHNESDDY